MPVINPHLKCRRPVAQTGAMGRQSQQRVSNQQKRACRQAQKSGKRRKGDHDSPLQRPVGFTSERDCQVCKAQCLAKFVEGVRIPKRAHNVWCIKNTKTRGKGPIPQHQLEALKESRRLQKLFTTPLSAEERGSWKHSTVEAGAKFLLQEKRQCKAETPEHCHKGWRKTSPLHCSVRL